MAGGCGRCGIDGGEGRGGEEERSALRTLETPAISCRLPHQRLPLPLPSFLPPLQTKCGGAVKMRLPAFRLPPNPPQVDVGACFLSAGQAGEGESGKVGPLVCKSGSDDGRVVSLISPPGVFDYSSCWGFSEARFYEQLLAAAPWESHAVPEVFFCEGYCRYWFSGRVMRRRATLFSCH